MANALTETGAAYISPTAANLRDILTGSDSLGRAFPAGTDHMQQLDFRHRRISRDRRACRSQRTKHLMELDASQPRLLNGHAADERLLRTSVLLRHKLSELRTDLKIETAAHQQPFRAVVPHIDLYDPTAAHHETVDIAVAVERRTVRPFSIERSQTVDDRFTVTGDGVYPLHPLLHPFVALGIESRSLAGMGVFASACERDPQMVRNEERRRHGIGNHRGFIEASRNRSTISTSATDCDGTAARAGVGMKEFLGVRG
jgi:hypothetical protein